MAPDMMLLSRVGSDDGHLVGLLPAIVVFGLGLAASVAGDAMRNFDQLQDG